jgi:hypothetical protein
MSEPVDRTPLLPCPRCGGRARHYQMAVGNGGHYVVCAQSNGFCPALGSGVFREQAESGAAWNHYAASAAKERGV